MPRLFFDLNMRPAPDSSARPAASSPGVLDLAHRVGEVGGAQTPHRVTPQEVQDLLLDVEDARAHRLVPRKILDSATDVLARLHHAQRRATDPERRQDLKRLVTQLREVVQTQLVPAVGLAPSLAAQTQLNAIADAARMPSKLATVSQAHVASTHNAVLGPVLHTGDEVWAAAAARIRQATQSVQLQTWAYHRRSESARHIMGALADLQYAQALRRERGEAVVPIDVEIVRGSQSWGQSPDDKTGGQDQSTLAQALAQDRQGMTSWHYGIFPFAVDPSLMRVRFSERHHRQRGAMHGKTLIVDQDIGLLTSANVKGSHHRASNYDTPFHDSGLMLAGDAVKGAMVDDFRAGDAFVRLVGHNDGEAPLSLDAIRADMQRARPDLTPAPLAREVQAAIADKLGAIETAVDQWRTSGVGAVEMVALSKAPLDRLYVSAPDSPQRRAMLQAIDGAQKSIEINNTNFNADDVVAALKRAMDRGVNIKILTSEHYNDNLYRHKLGNNTNREVFSELIRYRLKHGGPGGLSLKWHPNKQPDGQAFKNSHTKVMFIDQHIAIVGSANLDAQSWSYSGEFNFATHDPQTVFDLRASLFESFWAIGRIKIDMPHLSDDAAALGSGLLWTSETTTPHGSDASTPQLSSTTSLPMHNSPQETLVDTDTTSVRALSWREAMFDTQTLNASFKTVLAGTSLADKDAFMASFNTDFAPRLITEEAAIERLVMKHNRLSVSPDTTFAMNIENNVFGEVAGDYAASYRRASSFVSATTGIRANLYVPEGPEPQGAPQRAIIAYEGITFKPDGLHKRARAPVGFRDAFDARGIGLRAFETDQAQLLAWSRALLAEGRDVTITGFSLGGTLAARHLAAHTAEERGRIRLLTYAAPGLDASTAKRLASTDASIDARHFRTRKDPVTRVGREHAPGSVFKLAPRVGFASWFNHTAASMSNRELQGDRIELFVPTKAPEARASRRLEWARRLFGRLPLPR